MVYQTVRFADGFNYEQHHQQQRIENEREMMNQQEQEFLKRLQDENQMLMQQNQKLSAATLPLNASATPVDRNPNYSIPFWLLVYPLLLLLLIVLILILVIVLVVRK